MRIRFNPDESNIYLCIGVLAVTIGLLFIYAPAAFIFVGLVFGGLSFLMAQDEARNGTT